MSKLSEKTIEELVQIILHAYYDSEAREAAEELVKRLELDKQEDLNSEVSKGA